MSRPATALGAYVQGLYDLQKLRIMSGQRVVANFKVKLGIEPGTKEDESDAVAKSILKRLREEHDRISDSIASKPALRAAFEESELISNLAEYALVDSYFRLLSAEVESSRHVSRLVTQFPIWTEFLQGVKGCGPMMAAVIVAKIDIRKARYASSLWAYAGLDVAADGRGRSRRAEHLVTRRYVNKDGDEAERKGITFQPMLKTKLVGVLGPCFLKAGADGKYARCYYEYKHRLENDPRHAKKTKGHRHNMAMRYAVKRFLADLYVAWRTLEGLPVHPPYSESKLGMKHGTDT